MHKKILMNAVMNGVFTLCLVLLNGWALRNGFEETFLTFALIFGLVFIIGNALFIAFFFRK